ncbi:MAG TPA: 4Fe-4S dicluster domain-containing protein [Symbiobacteriaceae bacterium]|jgi:molybdopterin-containing oxidoreductase family iron-sulfur binding subunit
MENEKGGYEAGRREILAKAFAAALTGLAAGAVVAGSGALDTVAEALSNEPTLVPIPNLPPAAAGENQILRMMNDLRRALAKPMEKRHWGMVIDLRKCVGCQACTVSCITENKLPPGVVYRPVITEEKGQFPHVAKTFTPRPCMHCAEPSCVPVCPVGATFKRPDGIVAIDYAACIGCRYCITACPYNARTFDFGEFNDEGGEIPAYDKVASKEYGGSWSRAGDASPVGNARKCTFCVHRIEQGELPACTVSCMGRATYFGDLNDPESLIHELVGKANATRLKESAGTKPVVYYLQ